MAAGDQPTNSWFDGSSDNVISVHDNYLALAPEITADKSAAASGSEMRGGDNNFAVQADAILAQTPVPDHVEVALRRRIEAPGHQRRYHGCSLTRRKSTVDP